MTVVGDEPILREAAGFMLTVRSSLCHLLLDRFWYRDPFTLRMGSEHPLGTQEGQSQPDQLMTYGLYPKGSEEGEGVAGRFST
jgi:hypothetical protein